MSALAASPDLDLYRAMVRARHLALRLDALAEAGDIGFCPTSLGEEAAVLGAASALDAGDWFFPSHRDALGALARGVSIEALALQAFGAATSASKGRMPPAGFHDARRRIVSAGLANAAHAVQAVGLASAAAKDGVAALVTLTESALEAGELHNALNFAGVMKAPVVFLVRGPGEAQPSATARSVAYGTGSIDVDGGDALAVRDAVREALVHAREGKGAVVVGATSQGSAGFDAHDGLVRLAHALSLGDAEKAETDAALREIDAALASASRAPKPTVASSFDDVFAVPTWNLDAQRAQAARSSR